MGNVLTCARKSDSTIFTQIDAVQNQSEQIPNEFEDGNHWVDIYISTASQSDMLRLQRRIEKHITATQIQKRAFNLINGVPQIRLPKRFIEATLLGTGGQGIVIEVHSEDGCRCAIKTLDYWDHKFLNMIRAYREITLGKYICHPNVCELLEVFSLQESAEELFCIIMVLEAVETTLSHIIRPRNSSQNFFACHIRISTWMYQIFRALRFLHNSNIVHRDIKPTNIGLSTFPTEETNYPHFRYNQVKLLDLGMARGLANDRPMTPNQGTFCYMAPELLLEQKALEYESSGLHIGSRPPNVFTLQEGFDQYDSSVDIWAVGVIFIECLLGTSKKLFPATNVEQQQQMIPKILQIIPACLTEEYGKYIGNRNFSALTHYANRCANSDKVLDNILSDFNLPPDHYNMNGNTTRDLIKHLVSWNPKQRFTAEDAMRHEYFRHLFKEKDLDEVDCYFQDTTPDFGINERSPIEEVRKTVVDVMKERIFGELNWSRTEFSATASKSSSSISDDFVFIEEKEKTKPDRIEEEVEPNVVELQLDEEKTQSNRKIQHLRQEDRANTDGNITRRRRIHKQIRSQDSAMSQRARDLLPTPSSTGEHFTVPLMEIDPKKLPPNAMDKEELAIYKKTVWRKSPRE